jgi:hypothetical protein
VQKKGGSEEPQQSVLCLAVCVSGHASGQRVLYIWQCVYYKLVIVFIKCKIDMCVPAVSRDKHAVCAGR